VALAAESLNSIPESSKKDPNRHTQAWRAEMQTLSWAALDSISAVLDLNVGLERVETALQERYGFSELGSQKAVESAVKALSNDKRNERQ
jgi:hypothetical protein